MKIINIIWDTSDPKKLATLPEEIEIPRETSRFVCHKNEIKPDYNFLMGYKTGIPKEWWHGINGITFMFMGEWNDPLIGYKDYAINSYFVEDSMWELYNEECPAPDYYEPEKYKKYMDDFTKYMQDNAYRVFEILDDTIENTQKAIADYVLKTTGTKTIAFSAAA